jgi:amidase
VIRFLRPFAVAVAIGSGVGAPNATVGQPHASPLAEATVAELQRRMASGEESARSLVEKYLARIEALDRQGPALRSIIEINPDALAIADALDRERGSRGPRGPLHGIPVVIKDNIATADGMMTTAGSLALVGAKPPRDAFVVTRLRAAGAVILGKTNLSEWANFRSSGSTSGWSARGGQTRNPYALDRSPSGSSSGSAVAVAANLAAVAVGTETDGSIVSPAQTNAVVGIKPTVGLLSRFGIVPISHTQDTPGPIARTVADAAVLLGAMTGVDEADAATRQQQAAADYSAYLDPDSLRGARIGIVRNRLFRYSLERDRVVEAAIDVLKSRGAVIIDPANIPTLGTFDEAELQVLLYEFKDGVNRYLAWLGPDAPVKSLADVIAFNEAHATEELVHFDQDILVLASLKGSLDRAEYTASLAGARRQARDLGIDAVMAEHRLDALFAPTGGPAWPIDYANGDRSAAPGPSSIAAVAGYPHVTVPAGYIDGLPVGVSFFGRAWSEPKLIALAYAYEQATRHRRPPSLPAPAAPAR